MANSLKSHKAYPSARQPRNASSRRRKRVQREVAQRIRAMRRTRGWSQNSLALKCGLNRGLLGAIERGNDNLRLSNLLPIVTGLETTVAALFQGIA